MPTYFVYLTQTTERIYRIEARDPKSAMETAQEQAEKNARESLVRERCSEAVSWEVDFGAPLFTNGAAS